MINKDTSFEKKNMFCKVFLPSDFWLILEEIWHMFPADIFAAVNYYWSLDILCDVTDS